jgi:hypothetical protein
LLLSAFEAGHEALCLVVQWCSSTTGAEEISLLRAHSWYTVIAAATTLFATLHHVFMLNWDM